MSHVIRTTRAALLLACLFAMFSFLAIHAAEGHGAEAKPVTLKGEIVDLACYIDHGAKGAKHQQCALTCVKGGQPMGLLMADGAVYLLMADHKDGKPFEQTKDLAAEQVEISGIPAERAGIKGLTVKSVRKL